MFKSVRILMMATALLTVAAVPGHAQTDLTAAKQAVSECVAQVRRAATLRENYDQFGQPPMWRNFDAFVAPDGRVHENANFVGEQDGVYLLRSAWLTVVSASVSRHPPMRLSHLILVLNRSLISTQVIAGSSFRDGKNNLLS